jgi:hypothetical protein
MGNLIPDYLCVVCVCACEIVFLDCKVGGVHFILHSSQSHREQSEAFL